MIEPSIKNLIYKQALRQRKIKSPRLESKWHFHASEAGECPRMLYFKHLNRESEEKFESLEHEARVQMLLGDGVGVHQNRITEYIKESPNVHITNIEEDRALACEYKGTPYIITGHADGLLLFTKPKSYWILEIKGVSTYNIAPFRKQRLFDEDIDSLKLVYPKAIPQSRMYCMMYEHDPDRKIEGSIILIRDKNDSAIYEFHIPRDKKAESRIIDKFGVVANALANEGNVPCDFMKGDYHAKYCKYPNECGVGR